MKLWQWLAMAVVLFVGAAASVVFQPAEPTIWVNSGAVYTESEYRDKIRGYIENDGRYAICIDHWFHLKDIEANIDERFPNPADHANVHRVVELYEELCEVYGGRRFP